MTEALISLLYNAALLLLLVLGLPWWTWLLLTRSKFRDGLAQRFLGSGPTLPKPAPGCFRIWMHAVSVGEVLAITRLAHELTSACPSAEIIVSTTTRTGQQLARERFGAERCFYFPFDFPWSVRSVLRRLSPSILVLAESELWPNVLRICHHQAVPVVVVNARISDRSIARYLQLQALWRPFLQLLTHAYAQTPEDAQRLRQIGVPAQRIEIGGNLKFDVRPPAFVAIKEQLQQHLQPGAELLVCGSTLEGEESILFDAWTSIRALVPAAVMVLAPRHPERFPAVLALLKASSHPWVARSTWVNRPSLLQPGSIFLLDSIGELAALYALARVAFIGGSLVPAGGHNPLEPAQFGVAILMGPHFENFRAIADLLIAGNALKIVDQSSLAQTISGLLLHPEQAQALGGHALQLCQQHAGASQRCAEGILALLNRTPPASA